MMLRRNSTFFLECVGAQNEYANIHEKAISVITPQNTSYNVKKYSEGFPFERLY